ncbi:hypothetical protein HG535_0A03520 [Zygotorulaspora mrakii]|uniref:Thioredoxin domain-containing protein n=1 Tax=Zygotorulaspora mrakii TaxID=42260 RepID=A0A7H9AW25_ZYGMR|nr:uncharacterized protein HG535_0A03520 [Zygotorulaspora mrakii]QLG70413.1 hypothetical protein HG535_0A03520 [Zygotorulaspora mrakii]
MLSRVYRVRSRVGFTLNRRPYWNWIASNFFAGNKGNGPSVREPNQVFLSVRNENEMTDTLIASNRVPLVMNFTIRNNESCDILTGALNRIVMLETDKKINCVDVETDWPETKEILLRFGVHDIPSLVAVKKSFPVDYYTQKHLMNGEIDWYSLKSWIEKNAD